MTFKELYQSGQCSFNVISTWVEIWHECGYNQSLQNFLGLTGQEYQVWLTKGETALAQMLSDGRVPKHTAVHLGWEELKAHLQNLVDAERGSGFMVDLKPYDDYYWRMFLVTKQKIDKGVEISFEQDWLDNDKLCGLLSKLTHQEVISSHADKNGIWIICNDLS